MAAVFPVVHLWRGDFFPDRALLALVGHPGPVRLDAGSLAARARTLAGGSGDADLYVRFGAQPTAQEFDCRPAPSANES